MGAAAVSSKPEVEIIVFLAIMLHKAPAAFGLTTFLLQQASAKWKFDLMSMYHEAYLKFVLKTVVCHSRECKGIE